MIRVSVICVLLISLSGCGDTPPTDPELAGAIELLKTGLEAWKNGGTAASLTSGENPLRFEDDDWRAGAKLREYQVVKAGGEEEGETVCSVHLKLEARGKPAEKNVSYRVTLTPTRAVVRYPKR